MTPTIITISEKKVIGITSSMHHNEFENIVALWKRFMSNKKEVQNRVNSDLIALQTYTDFNNMEASFRIWACVEVLNLNHIPDGMLSLTIPTGNYAVFLHKGMDAAATYQKIMSQWLPNSGYLIDNRPHFQVMGNGYNHGSPDSEEDFYVPVKAILKP
ncbi:MAG: GyrI-like domain-containing protein [Winogradskyella sp.]